MKLSLAVLLALVMCGCAVQAQQSFPPQFEGRYTFRSEGYSLGQPFFEAGEIVADGQGNATLHSVFNQNGQVQQLCSKITVIGMAGPRIFVEEQRDCSSGAVVDTGALILSADGAHGHIVSMENFATWVADLQRDSH